MKKLKMELFNKIAGGVGGSVINASEAMNGPDKHFDPNQTYRFVCQFCKTTFETSGVGDNTLVICPNCRKNVR